MSISAGLFLPALLLFMLCGCAGAQQDNPAGDSRALTILTMPEDAQVREAITDGERQVTWGEPTAAGLWPGPNDERDMARAAIQAEAARLAAVDYTALALPNFVTQTRSLTLKPADFTGTGPRMEAYEVGSGPGGRGAWAIYGWVGPRFPDDPKRPLVHRWVEVYALYDKSQRRVLRLLATIRGEALE